jgi:transcriptional regulator with XRE-family HTH domain
MLIVEESPILGAASSGTDPDRSRTAPPEAPAPASEGRSVDDSSDVRRPLRFELKRRRNAADMTQKQVAQKLSWSPSKVIRMESGEVGVSVTDLRALAGLYDIPEGPELDELERLAAQSRRQPFNEFNDVLPKETIRFFAAEANASLIRSVQTVLVPGLFQSEAYSRALFAGSGLDPKRIDRIIAARKERQRMLTRATPPKIFAILDQAVLHRRIGGIEVLRAQLERLVELAQHPRISIQIMPFDQGAYHALDGAFDYLEFPDSGEPDVAFLDGGRGGMTWIDDPATVAGYQESFIEMEEQAAPHGELKDYVERALASS